MLFRLSAFLPSKTVHQSQPSIQSIQVPAIPSLHWRTETNQLWSDHRFCLVSPVKPDMRSTQNQREFYRSMVRLKGLDYSLLNARTPPLFYENTRYTRAIRKLSTSKSSPLRMRREQGTSLSKSKISQSRKVLRTIGDSNPMQYSYFVIFISHS